LAYTENETRRITETTKSEIIVKETSIEIHMHIFHSYFAMTVPTHKAPSDDINATF